MICYWREEDNYSREFLPVQAETVSAGKVLSGTSLIVYAPTGAGKTFVGEMAAMHAATAGRPTIYLVPTKALAEEKYALFCHLYGTLGLDIAISTRDRREADEQVSRGQFDLLITVPEKLRFLLSRAPGIAGRLGTVVVDELQLIGDGVRGPCLEVVLAQIISQARPQIVGLSAVIDQPQTLAEWLSRLQRQVEGYRHSSCGGQSGSECPGGPHVRQRGEPDVLHSGGVGSTGITSLSSARPADSSEEWRQTWMSLRSSLSSCSR